MMFFFGAMNALDPRKGDGWAESLVLVMLIGALIYCQISQIEISNFMASVVGVVVGYFFGVGAKREELSRNEQK